MSRRATLSVAYRFKGRAIEGSGVTLAQAVGELSDLWNGRLSLVMHSWGVMTVDITIAGLTRTFEVTDPTVLDASEDGKYDALVKWMAEKSGISTEEMQLLISQASDITASVDRIRPPGQPDFWQPDPGLDPTAVLPVAALEWSTALTAAAKATSTTTKKGREARKLVELVVRAGMTGGKSLAQIASETGIPRSTIGDAASRLSRRAELQLVKRKPGQRLSPIQKQEVLDAWRDTKSATEVERRLGVPARTVRDVVKRSFRVEAEPATPSVRRRQTGGSTAKDEVVRAKDEVVRLVESGMSASAAGRQVGVPERTARDWVKKAKDFPE